VREKAPYVTKRFSIEDFKACHAWVSGFKEQFSYCILGGPSVERIMDVVPRGMELELQLRRGVAQASHTCNNPHIKRTGVY